MLTDREWTREVFASRPYRGQRFSLNIRVDFADLDCSSEYYHREELADRRMAELIDCGYRVEKVDLIMTSIMPRIIEIAQKVLNVDTLETRGRDRLDFVDNIAVWNLRAALLIAFRMGQSGGTVEEIRALLIKDAKT